jgi:uncharacterized protein YqgC (DUF456 family)
VTPTDALVGLAILVGLAGIIVPVLPGTVLIAGALLAWALEVQTATAWAVFALSVTLLAVGTVVKYAVPGRALKATVPSRTLVVGALLALVGFFVIPVVGIFVGFPVGVYLAERSRVGPAAAWPSTKAALRAVGLSILIELAFAVLATLAWVVGVVLVR